jgi:DNA gyrase subunit A
MSGEQVVQLLPLPQEAEGKSVGLLSSDGRFKRLPLAEFQDLSGRATSILKLKEGVSLKRVVLCQDGDDLVVGSSTGRLLRLEVNEENLPVMGRNAQGPVLLRLLPGEEVIGAAAVDDNGDVWLATKHGSIKQMAAAEIRECNRGDIGQICMRFGQRDDQVVDLQSSNTRVLGALLSDGRSLRIDSAELAGSPDGTQQLGLGSKEALAELVPLLS